MTRLITTLIIYCYSIFSCSLIAQPDLVFTNWVTGLSSPVDIANAGDGTNRLFIVERGGIIKIIENNVVLDTPFMNISERVTSGGERGLLGLVFHPDYASNGYFYVNYTDNNGDTKISRFKVDIDNDDLGDPDSEVILLEIEQPFSNHNAGDLSFGTNDGYLYIASGDGGSGGDPGNRAQDGECLLGKMLRVDVDGGGGAASSSQTDGNCNFTSSANYTIPSNNPFVSDPNTLDEIWSIGLRNPWRFSFDSESGHMWLSDVGQVAWEEVNFEKSGIGGINYGWRCYEGDNEYNTNGCGDPSNYKPPDFEYAHPIGHSLTGGYVYRGSEFPNMIGYYIMADYETNRVWSLFRAQDGTMTSTDHGTGTGAGSISTFGVDENEEMYAANLSGIIYKVEDSSPLPVELSSFTGFHDSGINKLNWRTESEINTDYFDIEKSNDGITFTAIGKVEAKGDTSDPQKYQYEDQQVTVSSIYYRLKIMDNDGYFEYSKIINITINTSFDISIYPNPNNGKFSISINGKFNSKSTLKIYNSNGELSLIEEFEKSKTIQKTYDFSNYLKGIYLVQFSSGDYTKTLKLVIR